MAQEDEYVGLYLMSIPILGCKAKPPQRSPFARLDQADKFEGQFVKLKDEGESKVDLMLVLRLMRSHYRVALQIL